MADVDDNHVEEALNKLMSVNERSGNLRKDLKQEIAESVSTLRYIIGNLRNCMQMKIDRIKELENQVAEARTEIQASREAERTALAAPSLRETQHQRNTCGSQVLPPGGQRKSYSHALNGEVDKRYKLTVRPKTKQSPEATKTLLRTKINPTQIKVGIKTFKSLKDGSVLIETGSKEEINLLRSSISDQCGDQVSIYVPELRKPRMIIYNVPNDVSVENAEETIKVQNPELNINEGDIVPKFIFKNKRESINLVLEVKPDMRKKLLQTKLKIGWLICNVEDYLVAKRCFKCSRFNHRYQECKREDTCPLCAAGHKLRECTAPQNQHKCINCITYNTYNTSNSICTNHSSLDKNCPSLIAVLTKYRQNIEY